MEVTVWFDSEGYFRETTSDSVMEKVDLQGNSISLSILQEIVDMLVLEYHQFQKVS